MDKVWIIATVIFLVMLFLFWKLTSGHFKKELGEKSWNHWRTRLYYWQGTIYASTGITFMILFLLRWANILSF